MKILSVASEIFPLIKTGGLADVAGALPIALAAQGLAIRSLVPGYPAVVQGLQRAEPVVELHDLFGGRARVLAATASGLDLLVLDAPHLYARPGNPYVGPDGHDWADNGLRFAALARVAADIGLGLLPGFVPDVVHAHDWQAALAPAYLHYDGRRRAGTLVTIHNVAFQGVFPSDMLLALGLPPASFTLNGVEYYGNIGYLKAGLQFADRITTVSPTYAVEICTPEGGRGLDGLLRARARVLDGILNGIDETVWSPATDRHIVSNYDRARIWERAANKPAVQEMVGLVADPNLLLFGMVGRMTPQKGLDLVLEALPALLDQGGQLVLLGSGDARLEQMFLGAAAAYPGRVAVRLGYDERVAHWIQAGSDALLVPSRFEPCGLTQLCALRYGAVPVVARVGGLADTIIDANEAALEAGVATGIQFAPVTAHMLRAAIIRAAGLWRAADLWKQIQRNAMATEVGWRRSAARYVELYRQLARA